ncbi:MAG: TMEM175 family protein [Gammaproteobacteria bacterium]
MTKVEKNGFRWRGTEITRLEQFSDAVFAFALALLVVSTELPKDMAGLYEVLRAFPAFGATFAVLVWIWYLHYQYFRRYGLVNPVTIFLNGVLLCLILFYVYPLRFLFGALLGGLLGGPWAFGISEGGRLLAIYSAGFISVFALIALLYRHALAHADALALTPREVDVTRTSMRAHLTLAGVGTVSALLALTGPDWMAPVAGLIYFLIGPVMWWYWSRFAKRWLNAGMNRRVEDSVAGDDA